MLATFMLTRLRSDRSQNGGQVDQCDVTSQVEHQDVERVPFSSWNNLKSLKTFSYFALKCDLNKDGHFLPLPVAVQNETSWYDLTFLLNYFFSDSFSLFQCSLKEMCSHGTDYLPYSGCWVSVVFVWTNQNRGQQCGNEKTNMSKQQNWNDLFQRW